MGGACVVWEGANKCPSPNSQGGDGQPKGAERAMKGVRGDLLQRVGFIG